MEQHLRIYRRHHTCTLGHTKPTFADDLRNKNVQDCSCGLYVTGYLKTELKADGKQRRIQDFSLKTSDWNEAKAKRDELLRWGQLTPPATGIEALQADHVTLEDAIKFFFECGAADASRGRNVVYKYKLLLEKRLLPWCSLQPNPITTIKAFDTMVTCRSFFNSWRKRVNVDNVQILETSDQLGQGTKKTMLERYRTFLGFCVSNGWLKNNYAKDLSVDARDVAPKYAWTMEEYQRILESLELWEDEYGRVGTPEAIRQHVFFLALRYTGQRVSDITMIGPDSLVQDDGIWFVQLTQVKTGSTVKIPVPVDLVKQLQALPLLAELDTPYILKVSKRTIEYGTKFWFWTGESLPESATKRWSIKMTNMLRRCEKQNVKFKHKSSAHTTRHFFAITMLNAGTPIERVARWLGHSTPIITAKHYGHANADYHKASHQDYMAALAKIEGTPVKAKERKLKLVKIG